MKDRKTTQDPIEVFIAGHQDGILRLKNKLNEVTFESGRSLIIDVIEWNKRIVERLRKLQEGGGINSIGLK